MEKHLETPLTEKKVKELHAGDYVYISGTVYTARDAAHKRMIETLEKGKVCLLICRIRLFIIWGLPRTAKDR